MEGWQEAGYRTEADAMEAVYGGRCVHEIYGVQACADFVGYQTCDCEIKDEEPSEPTDAHPFLSNQQTCTPLGMANHPLAATRTHLMKRTSPF